MATSQGRAVIHPLRYVASTVVFTVVGAAVLGVLTVVMFSAADSLGPPFPHLYVTALLGFALILSQEMFDEDITGTDTNDPDTDDRPIHQEMVLFLLALVFYNLLMFATLIVLLFSVEAGVGRVAYLIAFLYPVYDLKTGTKMNPLSVTGFIAWVLTGLYVVGWISGTVVELVQDVELEPFRIVDALRFRRPG